MLTATTTRPRARYTVCSRSIVEGNSLVQYGHVVFQK
jgi:hypothetical protein